MATNIVYISLIISGLATIGCVIATIIAYKRSIKLKPEYLLVSYIRNRPTRSSVIELQSTTRSLGYYTKAAVPRQESGVGVRSFMSSSMKESEALETPYKKGDFIGAKYEIYGVLGVGGFGVVYLVYDHSTKAVLALKTFRDKYLANAETRERFRREAEMWANMGRHPYLVHAYFIDEVADRLYIAMEYIAAPDKKGRLNSLAGYLEWSPPDLAQSLRWAIQFCYGMEYVYEKGIPRHGDIKPDNIIISLDKTVKISDFGLADVLDEPIGVPFYMPPEQFTNPASCDERSDIYSFGIVLYQMAADNHLPPFLDNSSKKMYELHSKSPVPELSSPLFPIIQRCLEKKPDRRYPTFKEMRRDLETLLKEKTGEVIKPPELTELEAWELVNKGKSLTHLGRFDEAICSFDSALEINPRGAEAYYNRGIAYQKKDEFDRAIADYNEALDLNPRSADAYNNRGTAYGDKGEYDRAIADYNEALELNPRSAEAYNNRGLAYAKKGSYDRAIADYNEALKINPRDAVAYNNRGIAYGKKGEYDRTIADFNRALEITPRFASAWNNKGDSLDILGRYEEAIKCYEKAIELDPKNASTWYKKGLAEEISGGTQDTIRSYKRFIELSPSGRTQYEEQIQHAQQRLRRLEECEIVDTR